MTARRAFSATEVMVAVVICVVVLVPLLGLLVQERTTTVRGTLSFLGYLAAREEVGDIRFRLAAGVDPASVAHGWTPLKDSTFARLRDATVGPDPGLTYDPAQQRIETKVELASDVGSLLVGKLSVRYAKDAAVAVGDPGNVEFSFGMRRPGPVTSP